MKLLSDSIRNLQNSQQQNPVINDSQTELLPDICELPNGEYKAYFYAWVFELADGRKFKTHIGVKHGKCCAKLLNYKVENGEFREIEKFFNGCEKHITELPNGTYKGRWFAYCFELENGEKYKTDIGLLRSRELTPLGTYSLVDGALTELEMC